MKYIIYIIFIACLATLSFLYSSNTTVEKADSAVWVDGRSISNQEIERLKLRSPSLFTESTSLPDSLIMREVLINEALRQKVDQEEAFRHRIKTFYEQSLVKILVERKMESIQYEPSMEESQAYTNLLGRRIAIELIPLDGSGTPLADKTEHLAGPFLDFSAAIRMELLFLKPGEQSRPLDLFGQKHLLMVKEIGEKDPQFINNNPERDRTVIREYRREALFAQWQETLMKQAKIVVAPKEEGAIR